MVNQQSFWQKFDKSTLPKKPGIYIYKNLSGEVIYVGKAINLYNRVCSYFRNSPRDLKTADLVENISSCETIEVQSELEALILEANLIKKYHPRFNIKLLDDKDFLYIKITDEELPRILTARKQDLKDAKEYFGPFPSSKTVTVTLKKLRSIFPWCSAKKPRHVCFYYHLGLCPGPCVGKINKTDYAKIIKSFSKFMNGKQEDLKKDLEKEMKDLAKNLHFEQAEVVKKTLTGLEYLTQTNNISVYLENPNFIHDQNQQSLEMLKKDLSLNLLPVRIECYDISNIQGQFATGSLVVLMSGEVDKESYRKFKIKKVHQANDVAMLKEVLKRRINHLEWLKPDLILVDGGKGQVRGVWEELQANGWNIPVFGLAKRMEYLYDCNAKEIRIPRASLSLFLLQKIRDEAHRFAITYHRKLRDKI